MSGPPPFDAATLAELERLKARDGAVVDIRPPTTRAGEAAAELARDLVAAPPSGVSPQRVAEIDAAARAEIQAKLNQAEKTDGQQSVPQTHRRAEDKPAGGGEGPQAAAPESDPGEAEAEKPKGKFAPVKALGFGQNPNRPVAKDQSVARFASVHTDPADVVALAEDHPAVIKGRSLFSHKAGVFESARFLVSGKNNPKLGAEFRKGPWDGFPLYHVTLEERATCPRSCLQWRSCYGNAMHLARRHDHTDPDFLPALKAEVVTVARQHPKGFVVRLHTLGDFYSVEYVQVWADLLDALPNLRVFGYTARREDADDEESRRIAKAIRWLTEQAWDLFAIRFSGHDGPQGTIVVMEPDEREHVIMCPAQTYATHACVTCGLCSSPEARDKTIGFLLHGMKRSRKPRDQDARTPGGNTGAAPAPGALREAPGAPLRRQHSIDAASPLRLRDLGWKARVEAGETLTAIAKADGVDVSTVSKAMQRVGAAVQRGMRARPPDPDRVAEWKRLYVEEGLGLHAISARTGSAVGSIRNALAGEGVEIRPRGSWRAKALRQKRIDRAQTIERNKASPPAPPQATAEDGARAPEPSARAAHPFFASARPAHARSKLDFEPGEQERLIEQHLKEKGVTECPPGHAWNAETAKPAVGSGGPVGGKVRR